MALPWFCGLRQFEPRDCTLRSELWERSVESIIVADSHVICHPTNSNSSRGTIILYPVASSRPSTKPFSQRHNPNSCTYVFKAVQRIALLFSQGFRICLRIVRVQRTDVSTSHFVPSLVVRYRRRTHFCCPSSLGKRHWYLHIPYNV